MFNITTASLSDFQTIKTFIQLYQLDDRALQNHQFLVAKQNQEIQGFGRIRKHTDCCELCSLGVIEPERLKGVGKKLVASLIKSSENPLYLVCIIPEFFTPFGFKITTEYPGEMAEKLNYCTSELAVKEPYVVMKYDNSDQY